MNIANIFGLHIGCRIKHSFVCDNRLHEGISLLTGVEILQGGTILLEAGFKEYNYEYCKIILKPLSKITDEDKAEFFKEFDGLKHLEKDFSGINSIMGICELVIENKSHRFKVSLTGKVSLWLCSKGYDIGLVPDEYKEVEE